MPTTLRLPFLLMLSRAFQPSSYLAGHTRRAKVRREPSAQRRQSLAKPCPDEITVSAARLTIDGVEVNLGGVWIHWKAAPASPSSSFSLLVRGEFVVEVFDPWKRKPSNKTWESYILETVSELCSVALGAYIDTLKNLDELAD